MEIFNEAEWNEFRAAHPELRFWQAMRAYLYVERIMIEYRDVIPWDEESKDYDEEPDESEDYKQEREDERMDEHFAPSEGNVY